MNGVGSRDTGVALPAARLLWLALAAGLVVRLALLPWVGQLGPRIVDEQHFTELAGSIYEGRGFVWANGTVTSIRPPLYPAFLATVWTVAGEKSLLAVRVAQMTLALASAWLVYCLGTAMFDQRTGALAAAGAALYPSLIFANVTLLTETLFTFLLLLTTWLCHLALKEGSVLKMALAGGVCALTALTRSVMWPFPVVGALIVVAVAAGSWRRKFAMAAVFGLCHAVVLAPWAIRNTQLQGVFTVVDTMSGFNLWMANSDATPRDRIWDAIGQGGQERFGEAIAAAFPGHVPTEGEKDRWGRSAAFRYMVEHPGVTFQRSLRKFADFWGLDRELLAPIVQGVYAPPGLVGLIIVAAVVVAYPVAILLAAIGIWMTEKIEWRTHVMVGAIVLFVCGIHTLAFGHSRYRLPLMPFLLIYAAAALRTAPWRSFVNVDRWKVVAVTATMCVLGAIWIQELAVRDADRVRALLTHLVP